MKGYKRPKPPGKEHQSQHQGDSQSAREERSGEEQCGTQPLAGFPVPWLITRGQKATMNME